MHMLHPSIFIISRPLCSKETACAGRRCLHQGGVKADQEQNRAKQSFGGERKKKGSRLYNISDDITRPDEYIISLHNMWTRSKKTHLTSSVLSAFSRRSFKRLTQRSRSSAYSLVSGSIGNLERAVDVPVESDSCDSSYAKTVLRTNVTSLRAMNRRSCWRPREWSCTKVPGRLLALPYVPIILRPMGTLKINPLLFRSIIAERVLTQVYGIPDLEWHQ